MDKDQQLFRTKIFESPAKIQEVLVSDETTASIRTLNTTYGISKPGVLAHEVGRVLVGLTHPKDFKERLVTEIELPTEKATALARDINREIFAGVKDLLMHMYDIKAPEGSVGAAKETQTAPEKTPLVAAQSTQSTETLPPPKPRHVTSPFSNSQNTEKDAGDTPTPPLPPAPKPPAGYDPNLTSASPNTAEPTKSPENPFEALLKKKMRPGGESKAVTDTPETPKTKPDNEHLGGQPEVAEATPKPKLHTTVAKAVPGGDKETEKTPAPAAGTDPYREPVD